MPSPSMGISSPQSNVLQRCTPKPPSKHFQTKQTQPSFTSSHKRKYCYTSDQQYYLLANKNLDSHLGHDGWPSCRNLQPRAFPTHPLFKLWLRYWRCRTLGAPIRDVHRRKRRICHSQRRLSECSSAQVYAPRFIQ